MNALAFKTFGDKNLTLNIQPMKDKEKEEKHLKLDNSGNVL